MATRKEANLFEERILASVGSAAKIQTERQWTKETIAGFLAMQGNSYNGDLMVVGRAVNGWREPYILPLDLTCQASRKRWALSVFNNATEDQGQCPMNWVMSHWGARNGYNTRGSAFWRVVRMVIGGLSAQTLTKNSWPPRFRESWPSHLVWSNLYKLAPKKGRNPNGQLRTTQHAGCIALLKAEIKIYRPRRLLLLTGRSWAAPFLDALSFETLCDPNRYVRFAGRLALPNAGQTHFVVASHPERKPEKYWVQEVLHTFQWLETANRSPYRYLF